MRTCPVKEKQRNENLCTVVTFCFAAQATGIPKKVSGLYWLVPVAGAWVPIYHGTKSAKQLSTAFQKACS